MSFRIRNSFWLKGFLSILPAIKAKIRRQLHQARNKKLLKESLSIKLNLSIAKY
jgi:hypothetical protein